MRKLNETTLQEKFIRAMVFTVACAVAYVFGKKLLKFNGARPSKTDKRDFQIAPAGATSFSESFSLKTPPVENQGNVNSCVAHSCSYLCESVMNEKDKLADRHFATGFVYGYRPAGYYQGQGMYPREALKTLQEVGNVPKQVYPYNVEVPEAITAINKRLGEFLPIAKGFKIKSYFRLNTVDDIKNCLMNISPVTAMYPVYETLNAPKGGKVEFDGGKGFRGYHQMSIYGWSGKYWKVLNSWGGEWDNDGDKDGATLISMDYPIIETWGVTSNSEVVVQPPVAKKSWTNIFCPWRW
jgi:hypothetical protein